MSWLALWLLAVGVMDLCRATRPRHGVAPVVGVGVLAIGAALTGLLGLADVLVLAASIVPMVTWWWASERAQGIRGRDHVLALASLVAGVVLLLGLSGWAGEPGGLLARWMAWANLPFVGAPSGSATDLSTTVLVVALLVANLSTGNILVRLVLVSIGALRPRTSLPQPADRLRGGRLLGPMERLLILGLGMAGQLTAAGLVIAAKGLIRFPELQSRAKDGTGVDGLGIDEMTEYFLVGSFVSWLVALGSLALLR